MFTSRNYLPELVTIVLEVFPSIWDSVAEGILAMVLVFKLRVVFEAGNWEMLLTRHRMPLGRPVSSAFSPSWCLVNVHVLWPVYTITSILKSVAEASFSRLSIGLGVILLFGD